jgi:hypothetical protein
MAQKKELVQFSVKNNTDCDINVPLLQRNIYSINATTKYSWNIQTIDLSCGTGSIVINGATYQFSYTANSLTSYLAALNSLGFGFFCTEIISSVNFLFTQDDTNVYGNINDCATGTTTSTTTTSTTAVPTTSTTTTSTTLPSTSTTTTTTTGVPTTSTTTTSTTDVPTTSTTTTTTTVVVPTTSTTTTTTTDVPTTSTTTTTTTDVPTTSTTTTTTTDVPTTSTTTTTTTDVPTTSTTTTTTTDVPTTSTTTTTTTDVPTTSTTTTTTTAAAGFIISNTTGSGQIDNVTTTGGASFYTINTGSFPVTNGNQITGIGFLTASPIFVDISNFTSTSCLSLYINSVLNEAQTVSANGTITFTNKTFTVSDSVLIEYVLGVC